MNIRDIKKDDIPKVLEILEENLAKNLDDKSSGFLTLQFSKEELLNYMLLTDYFIVCEDNGEVVGYLLGGNNKITDTFVDVKIDYLNFFYVKQVGVSKKAQGKGVGKSLYSYIFDNIEEDRVCLSIVTKPRNFSSESFHMKQGFIHVSEDISCNYSVAIYMREKESFIPHTGKHFSS